MLARDPIIGMNSNGTDAVMGLGYSGLFSLLLLVELL
jgi:hypothetical protein